MPLLAGMARALFIFLILRMVASPLALRPESPGPRSNFRFVVRVCAWPDQRFQRTPSASVVLEGRLGNGPGAIPDRGAWPRPLDFCPQVRTILALLVRQVVPD